MSPYSIKKDLPEIGKIEYKIASSRKELEEACALVYKEYLSRGFIQAKDYKSDLRITLHHILPGTTTFIALKDKEVVATNTIMPDSLLGLPLDVEYKEEADKLRNAGRKICEAGYLAINTELFGSGHFSMFNFKKLEFMFTLFKLLFQYALNEAKFDDICIVTDPKYMIFKFLPFEVIGKVKYYGYDRVAIKKKAAVFKRLDLGKIEGWSAKKIALRRIFLEDKIPKEMFANKFHYSLDDLSYFFMDKSDILERATKQQKEYIRSCYGLRAEDFAALLERKGQYLLEKEEN